MLLSNVNLDFIDILPLANAILKTAPNDTKT